MLFDSSVIPNRPTLREVFDEHAGLVLRVVRHMGVRPAEVEDVAQEVFMVVHRRLEDFDPERAMRPWVMGITRKVALRHIQRSIRRQEVSQESAPEPQADAGQDAQLELKQKMALLAQALETLKEDQRTAFVLFELEDMPMAEVAGVMDCPLQTAYTRLYSARKAVRKFLEQAVPAAEAT